MSLLSLCLVILSAGHDQDPWVDILRDAQATNQAKVRQGSANLTLKFIPAPSITQEPTALEADVFWQEDRAYERYKFISKSDYPLNQKNTLPIEDSPWNFLLDTGNEFCFYNSTSKILTTNRSQRRGSLPSILAFEPAKAWFGCCPPDTNDSRPWMEMIDLRVKTKTGESSRNTYEKQSGRQILQRRRDPDGFTLMVTYDLDQGGNPIQVASIPVDPQQIPTAGSYRWRKIGDAFVLDRCDFRIASARFPREAETYELAVRSVVLTSPAPTLFEKAELLKSLKGSIRIKDLVNNRETVRNADQAEDEASLKALSGKLKAGGFGQPR